MNGVILLNPFGVPKESVFQAERLKAEFLKLNVNVDIDFNGYLRNAVLSGKVVNDINCDFVIYLDKDKYLSACLEKKGIKVFNKHSAIRACDDKGITYITLSNNGINIPDTYFAPVCYNSSLPLDLASVGFFGEKLGYPVIIKESYGSMGKGVYKADNLNELISVAERLKTTAHIYQRYIGNKVGVDVRLIVIGGKFVCAMIRKNDFDFRSNIALGGKGVAFEPPEDFISVAEQCAKVLELDYCGVDLLFGENDKPYVCEVNSNAFIGEIERVTGVNVAKFYAEHVVKSVVKR